MKRVSQEVKQAVRLVRSGHTLKAAAAQTGARYNTLYQTCVRKGVRWRKYARTVKRVEPKSRVVRAVKANAAPVVDAKEVVSLLERLCTVMERLDKRWA